MRRRSTHPVILAGLGLLVRLHRRLARHGGNVMLANVHGAIATVIANTRLSDVFRIYGDVDEARRALAASGRDA